MAKKLFKETYNHTPWDTLKEKKDSYRWPILNKLLSQKWLSYLDYVLTHKLLECNPEGSEGLALFVCHLILATKEGHLCVRINDEKLHPSIHQLWQNEDGHHLSTEEADRITQLALKGSESVFSIPIISNSNNDEEILQSPICRNGDDFYLQRHWIFETMFLKYFKKHLLQQPSILLNIEKIEESLQSLQAGKVILYEQAQAILAACQYSVTLITGGPGTGKTYTAGNLIKIFWNHLTEEDKKSCQIVLVAPTGKAAANLQRSVNIHSSQLQDFSPIQAHTLHSLLKLKQYSEFNERVYLSADLVIVDESSMIDIRMMAYLFKSLKPGSRLILLGDPHQLPSVEAGSVFRDLVQRSSATSSIPISCVNLTVCMRAELESLIDFARMINKGDSREVLSKLGGENENGIKRLYFKDGKKSFEHEFLNYVISNFDSILNEAEQQEGFLELFQKIRVLSPVRKGRFGVESLNRLIWQRMADRNSQREWIAVPIIITVNDYQQELFNGETGVLMRRFPLQGCVGLEDYALFSSREGGKKLRRLAACVLPRFELAYCLSVHKSQGSEFDKVIFVVPEGAEIFGREIFYTAVTRARKSIEIFASDEVIEKTVVQEGNRLSGIKKRLVDVLDNVCL